MTFCYFGLFETLEQIGTFSLVGDMAPQELNIMKHMRMVACQPRPFDDQHVLLHLTQYHEDDEHLDDGLPLRPIPSPLVNHSTVAPEHSITLDDIYHIQQHLDRISLFERRQTQRMDRLEQLHFKHVGQQSAWMDSAANVPTLPYFTTRCCAS